MTTTIRSEDAPTYSAPAKDESVKRKRENALLQKAAAILERRLLDHKARPALTDPKAVREYLRVRLAGEESERFLAIWLSTQHRVLACEVLSSGTIDGAAIYPREVIKAALRHNAAAVIFAHNHPSGNAEPSAADRFLTDRLKGALAQVDIRVLDHIVVGTTTVSFAERGWV